MNALPRIAANEAYLATRVRLMADRLVPPDALRTLIETDLNAVPTFLQGLGIEARDPTDLVHSGRLFQVLLSHLLRDFAILLQPLCPGGKQLFRYWLRRYELRNIKTIMHGRIARQSTADIRENLLDLHPFDQIDSATLLATEDVSELLRVLERSPFAAIARQARHVAEHEHAAYRLDASLDREYWGRLIARVDNAQAQDQPGLRKLIGEAIDIHDLVALLRLRFAYQLPPAESYYLLIGHGHLLQRRVLLRLVEKTTLSEVINALPAPLRETLADADSTLAIERRLERHAAHTLMDVYRHAPSFVTRTMAFLMLRESDMHRLRSVMRGKILGLAPQLIRDSINLGASRS